MRRKAQYILLFLVLIQASAWAQFIDENIGQKDIRTKRMVVKIDPTLWFFGPIPGTGDYRVSLEFALGLKNSVQIGLSYVGKSIPTIIMEAMAPDSAGNTDYTLNGFRFQFSYKYYPFGNYKSAPEGFFFGPHVSYTKAYFHDVQGSPKYSDYSVTYANAAIIFGYQFIANDRIAIEIFQGLGYRDNRIRNEYTGEEEKINYNPDYTPIPGDLKIYFGANIGLNF